MVVSGDDGYGLSEAFERAVIYSCCARPSFWKRVGGSLDPKRMHHPLAQILLAACRVVAAETGRPPTSSIVVVQRVSRWHREGKLKFEVVSACADFFDAAEEAGLPAEEDLVAELVPVVRRKMHSEAVIAAHDEFARRGDFKSVSDALDKASRLGEFAAFDDVKLSASGMHLLDDDGGERLPTGVVELDVALGGGLIRGGEGVVIADSGGGKSVFLVSQVAEASRRGMHVAMATLELSHKLQFARLVANLTGVPTNDLLSDPQERERARARLEETEGERGPVHIAEFSPHATTVRDLQEWVDAKEQSEGRSVDLLVVDYADKLWDPRSRDGNEYLTMRYVYEGLRRDLAACQPRPRWIWTASQPGRRARKESKAYLDLADVADSMHKVRVADLIVTINFEDLDDYSTAEFFVAKHRGGKARFAVGPLPTDFACGRMCASPGATEF